VNDYSRNPNGGITFTNHNGQVVLPIVLNKDSFILGNFYFLDVVKNTHGLGANYYVGNAYPKKTKYFR
jgi:hypothetical protein